MHFPLIVKGTVGTNGGPEDYMAPGVQSAWNTGGAQVGAIWG